jgi:protein involved in polysaccharide export with SLBB domain
VAEQQLEVSEYRFSPGDVVSIRQRGADELDLEFVVPSDGIVSLPIVGSLQVGGRTAQEIRSEVRSRWSAVLRDPDPSVILREARGARVTVGGAVARPGRTTLSEARTVADAVRVAGGLLPFSAGNGVVLLRRNPEGGVAGQRVRFEGDVEAVADRVLLAAGDLIYAPPSRTYRLLVWIDQYLNQMIPGGTYVFFWWPTGKNVDGDWVASTVPGPGEGAEVAPRPPEPTRPPS